VKLEGPGLHVSSVSPERGRKVKRKCANGLRQRELHVHANLLIAAHIRIYSLKFSVTKINAIIFGPPIGRGPPALRGSAGSVVTPLDTESLIDTRGVHSIRA